MKLEFVINKLIIAVFQHLNQTRNKNKKLIIYSARVNQSHSLTIENKQQPPSQPSFYVHAHV